MSMQDLLNEMKEIQQVLLELIDSPNVEGEDFQNQIKLLKSKISLEDPHILKVFLWLLNWISLNHYRTTNFFKIIDILIIQFQSEIKKQFNQNEIYDIFKNNRRLLLFLFKLQLINFDKHSLCEMNTRYLNSKNSYYYYFYPELEKVLNHKELEEFIHLAKSYEMWKIENSPQELEIHFDNDIKFYGTQLSDQIIGQVTDNINQIMKDPDTFDKKRLWGQNDSYICQLIRNNLFDEFVKYVNQTNFSLNAKIEAQICETNSLLLKKSPTLIEYAAFYGSYQIFNFLRMQNVQISPSLWIYAIHGNDANVIQVLEEMKIEPEGVSFKKYLKESIKCHHNKIANYILEKYITDDISNRILKWALKYFNFDFIDYQDIMENKDKNIIFYRLCKYDHYLLADFLLKNSNINVKATYVFQYFFYSVFFF